MCRVTTPENGFSAYWLDLANSDLAGPSPSDWSKVATASPVEWTGAPEMDDFLSCTVPKNTTERQFMFTPSGVPGTNGTSGDYGLVLRISAGQSDIKISFQVHRVNSSGTVQASSSTTSEQAAGVGVQTHMLTGVDLGTWNTGDRLRVDIITRNAKTSGGQITTTFWLGRRQTQTTFHQHNSSDELHVLSSQVL